MLTNQAQQEISIFLYDHDKNKIYGIYSLKNNIISKNCNNCNTITLAESSFRRGIFYSDDNSKNNKKYKDFSIYKIDENTHKNIYEKLNIINGPVRHSILTTSLKKDIFSIKYIDISKDFFIAESKITIDLHALKLLVEKYHSLINKPKSETTHIESFRELGRAFMNLFLPNENFNALFTRVGQIVYIECDEASSVIPWTIFEQNGEFLSERMIFSYLHLKNHFYPSIGNDTKENSKLYKIAVIALENNDLVFATKEAEFITSEFANDKHIQIDTYKQKLNYLEFIKICESYDILHIITHGDENGIILSDDYILTHSSIKKISNAPQLVFLSTCDTNGMEIYGNKNIISSFLASGVKTVVSSVGKLADDNNYSFLMQFYKHYLHEYSNISTATAYNFAIKSSAHSNIRYLFFGIPTQ